MPQCKECGKTEHVISVKVRDPPVSENFAAIDICVFCLDKIYNECEICRKYVNKQSCIHQVKFLQDGNFEERDCCERCFVKYDYTECDDCGGWFRPARLEGINGGGLVCRECLDDHYFQCESCCEWFNDDERHDIGDRSLCDDCAHEDDQDPESTERTIGDIHFNITPETKKLLNDPKSEL